MSSVTFAGVTKRYPDGTTAVDDLNLEIADGEFMVLVGPSGCGKSTALRMIAGLEEITEGDLLIGDKRVNELAPRARNVAMVFQNYALYPHMTVRQNMGFALDVARAPKDEIRRKVDDAAEILGLTEYLERRPKALSGGQRQRVAMGRAIVREPSVFLMDEPLSNLDAKLRVQMRSDIIRLQSRLGTTMVYVTHDQVEAMTMADRVAVLRRGLLRQVASPQTLYDEPGNLFVAGFIGSPAMNLLDVEIRRDGDQLVAQFGDQSLTIAPGALDRYPLLAARAGGRVVMGIRPEFFDTAADSDLPSTYHLRAVVELVEMMGSEVHAHFAVDAPAARTEETSELIAEGEESLADIGEGRAMATAKLSGTHRVALSSEIVLAVDTARCHFFDLDSGLPLR
jgi:multiple sugar transport system ATP-binding protein